MSSEDNAIVDTSDNSQIIPLRNSDISISTQKHEISEVEKFMTDDNYDSTAATSCCGIKMQRGKLSTLL